MAFSFGKTPAPADDALSKIFGSPDPFITPEVPHVSVSKHLKGGVDANTTNTDNYPKTKSRKRDDGKSRTIHESKKSNSLVPKKREIPKEEIEEKNKRTIFVGNLPIATKAADIKKLFRQFGDIESVRFRTTNLVAHKGGAKAAIILRNKFDVNEGSVNAYIVYTTPESASKAVERNGQIFEGRHLRVDIAVNSPKFDSHQTVFVGNLPFDVTEEELHSIFDAVGTVIGIRVIRDKILRVGKGFAYVNFALPESVPLALLLDGKEIRSRAMRVKRCDGDGTTRNLKHQNRSVHASKTSVSAKESDQIQNGAVRRLAEKQQKLQYKWKGALPAGRQGASHGPKVVVLDHRGKKPRHKPRDGPIQTESFQGLVASKKFIPKTAKRTKSHGRAPATKKPKRTDAQKMRKMFKKEKRQEKMKSKKTSS